LKTAEALDGLVEEFSATTAFGGRQKLKGKRQKKERERTARPSSVTDEGRAVFRRQRLMRSSLSSVFSFAFLLLPFAFLMDWLPPYVLASRSASRVK